MTPDKDENKESGPISGTLTATGWGHTWTEKSQLSHEMSLAVNAATGGDTSNMGLTAGEFKLTVGTADVVRLMERPYQMIADSVI